MAKLKQGFLGNAAGKLGNVVFSKWRDIQTVRQYQPDVKDANSEAQQKQRNRMVSLLQFLKPLNKNFIQFYNSAESKGTTPWAKAIKDNMPAVNSDGCIIPEDFSLGNPKYPPFDVINATYNPFIDLCQIDYKPRDLTGRKDPYPLIGTSVLGLYDIDDGIPSFNVNHPMCFLPPGHFFCEFEDQAYVYIYDNYFSQGWLWFYYHDQYDNRSCNNPNEGLTKPVYFKPEPLVKDFNMDVEDNLIPVDAITWEYKFDATNWNMVLNFDKSKAFIEDSENYSIRLWALAMQDDSKEITDSIDWSLTSNTFSLEIGESGFSGSAIVMYTVIDASGKQVNRFNKFYVDKGTDGVHHDYYDQLFYTSTACPTSFTLKDNYCGIYGSIDELCGEFIADYEQSIYSGDSESSTGKTGHTSTVIDYDNFKVEIYSEDGKFISEAKVNSKHEFYYDSMIVGHNYYVMIKYCPELFELIGVGGRRSKRVQYLSPAKLINTHEVELPSKSLKKALSDSCDFSGDYIPTRMSWQKIALERFLEKSPNSKLKYICPCELLVYKIADDFSPSYK